MAGQKYYEGQEFVSDDPSKPTLVYRAGKFFPKQDQPGGATSEGDEPGPALTPGSESRTRVVLGLGPSINAQRNLFSAEGWDPKKPKGGGENPYNKQWGAKLIGDMDESWIGQKLGLPLDPIAKWVGGQQYQDYQQANKTFEASFLPILSGANVPLSEAQRMIKASLAELGDSRETLSRKATNRAMMINGAADLAGKPRPFPKVGAMDLKGLQAGSQPREGQPRAPNTGVQVPPPEQRQKGKVYQTPKGPLRWTGTGWVQ